MKYKVLLFAVLAEIAQTHQIEMEIKKEMTAKKLIQNLVELYPKMKEYEDNLIVSVDTEEIEIHSKIGEVKQEVAVFPPVSGG